MAVTSQKLKAWDSRLYSAVGAPGELFAIRTGLFKTMPEDTLLDDFILSLRIAMQGYKIAYCDKAYAIESGSANMYEEQKRKVRIAAGGLQSIARLKELFNIFKYGILSFQYISHRVLRWSITPILLFLLFPLNIILIMVQETTFYKIMLILQIIFYILAWDRSHYGPETGKNKNSIYPLLFYIHEFKCPESIFLHEKAQRKRNLGKSKKESLTDCKRSHTHINKQRNIIYRQDLK